MKLGDHVEIWTDAARATVRRRPPKLLKVLINDRDELRRYKDNRPDGRVVVRRWFPTEELAWATRTDDVLRFVEPIRDLVDFVETPWNEAWQFGDELKRLAGETYNSAKKLQQNGLTPVVGNFSVGCPRLEEWGLFAPALIEGAVLGLHEYSAPRMQDNAPWYCLRYRQVVERLGWRPRILLTECGIDGGVLGKDRTEAGWRNFASAEDYANQLAWYDSELEKDSYVIGGVVFLTGGYDHWRSFDIAGETAFDGVMMGATGTYNVGQGFRDWQRLEPGVIGTFRENETYHRFGTEEEVSFAWTTNGLLQWTRRTNTMAFQANDGRLRVYAGGNPRWA